MASTSTRRAARETAPDTDTDTGSALPTLPTADEVHDKTAAEAAAMVKPADEGKSDDEVKTGDDTPADEWADLAVETAPADVPAVPFVPVPDTILALAKKAMADGSQMVRIEGMTEDRVKKLVAHIRNTKGHFPEIARVRTVPVKYRGETALKVTISKVTSTADGKTTQPEQETETG